MLDTCADAAFSTNALIRAISPASDELALAFWAAVASAGLEDPDSHLIIAEEIPTPSSSPQDSVHGHQDGNGNVNGNGPPNMNMNKDSAVFLGFAKWVLVPEGCHHVPGVLHFTEGLVETGVDGVKLDAVELAGDVELAKSFFAEQSERHERFMGERRHWYLELICTRPEGRGMGAGRELVRWGVERADREDKGERACEMYLEASPQGRPLFEKFGFRVVERKEYLDGGYVECSMMRGGEETGKGVVV